MKNKTRLLHINDKIWNYKISRYSSDQDGLFFHYISIISPDKKYCRVNLKDMFTIEECIKLKDTLCDRDYDNYDVVPITPSIIKRYIEKYLL